MTLFLFMTLCFDFQSLWEIIVFSAYHPGVKVKLNSPCCLICFSLPSVHVYHQHALQPTSTLTPLFHSVSNLIRVLSFLAALFCAGSCCCCSFDLMHTEGWASLAMTHAAKYELLRIEMSAFFYRGDPDWNIIVCNVDQSSYYHFAVRLGWSGPRC